MENELLSSNILNADLLHSNELTACNLLPSSTKLFCGEIEKFAFACSF